MPSGSVQFGTLSLGSEVIFSQDTFYLTPAFGLYPSGNFDGNTPLWTGTIDDPTFIPGSYSGTFGEGWVMTSNGSFVDDGLPPGGLPYDNYAGVLTIADVAPTPEPSSLTLMAIGLLALAAVFGRRLLAP